MRTLLALLLFGLTAGCKGSEPLPEVDRIQMRQSGRSAVDVEINNRGEGRYILSVYPPKRHGSFSISPQQFKALTKRLERFQRQAEPFTDESVKKLIEARCPKGVPEVTDAGGFWIRWVGAGYDWHYSADFGCDYERNRARNDELRGILRSLPVELPH